MTIYLWSDAICDQDSTPNTNRFHLQTTRAREISQKSFSTFYRKFLKKIEKKTWMKAVLLKSERFLKITSDLGALYSGCH